MSAMQSRTEPFDFYLTIHRASGIPAPAKTVDEETETRCACRVLSKKEKSYLPRCGSTISDSLTSYKDLHGNQIEWEDQIKVQYTLKRAKSTLWKKKSEDHEFDTKFVRLQLLVQSACAVEESNNGGVICKQETQLWEAEINLAEFANAVAMRTIQLHPYKAKKNQNGDISSVERCNRRKYTPLVTLTIQGISEFDANQAIVRPSIEMEKGKEVELEVQASNLNNVLEDGDQVNENGNGSGSGMQHNAHENEHMFIIGHNADTQSADDLESFDSVLLSIEAKSQGRITDSECDADETLSACIGGDFDPQNNDLFFQQDLVEVPLDLDSE